MKLCECFSLIISLLKMQASMFQVGRKQWSGYSKEEKNNWHLPFHYQQAQDKSKVHVLIQVLSIYSLTLIQFQVNGQQPKLRPSGAPRPAKGILSSASLGSASMWYPNQMPKSCLHVKISASNSSPFLGRLRWKVVKSRTLNLSLGGQLKA